MRSGPTAVSATCAARKAKLGLSLGGFGIQNGFGVQSGKGLRAELARRAAGEAVAVAARSGVTLFDTVEGDEAAMRDAGEGRLLLQLRSADLGAGRLEGRLGQARGRMRSLRPLTLMFEAARLLTEGGQQLWAEAGRLHDIGAVSGLGVTLEPGGDALGVARRFKPDLIHVCVGLLDQRLVASGALSEIAAMGVEVHLRTALLRGLLFLPRDGLPAAVAEAGPQVSRVRRLIAEAGADPLHAALSFALDRPEASGVIVEAASVGEVRAILAAAAAPSPRLDWPALALDHPAALAAEAGLRHRAA